MKITDFLDRLEALEEPEEVTDARIHQEVPGVEVIRASLVLGDKGPGLIVAARSDNTLTLKPLSFSGGFSLSRLGAENLLVALRAWLHGPESLDERPENLLFHLENRSKT